VWTAENRGHYDRSEQRYPSDLTDDEWALIEPLIPPAKPGGNKRDKRRDVENGIRALLRARQAKAAMGAMPNSRRLAARGRRHYFFQQIPSVQHCRAWHPPASALGGYSQPPASSAAARRTAELRLPLVEGRRTDAMPAAQLCH
jgi:hypothetical protein